MGRGLAVVFWDIKFTVENFLDFGSVGREFLGVIKRKVVELEEGKCFWRGWFGRVEGVWR